MAKAKKKKRGGFLGLLQQSFSGWKKLAKYAASGKWANDISRAMHRSGAGGRAKQAAQSRPDNYVPDYSQRDRVEASYQLFGDASKAKALTDAQLKQAFDEIRNGGKSKKDQKKPKKSASAAVKKAIAKVPTKVPRKGHQRAGTKGVDPHQTTVAKKDLQAAQAAEVLKTRSQVDPEWAKKMATPNPNWKRMTPKEVAQVHEEWEQKAKASAAAEILKETAPDGRTYLKRKNPNVTPWAIGKNLLITDKDWKSIQEDQELGESRKQRSEVKGSHLPEGSYDH